MTKSMKIRNSAEVDNVRTFTRDMLHDRDILPAELAAKTMVPLSTITRVLSGEVKNPSIDVVVSIAKGLEVSVSDLIGESWHTRRRDKRYARLVIEGDDYIGMLASLSTAIAAEGVNIQHCVSTRNHQDRARLVLTIEAESDDQIHDAITRAQEAQSPQPTDLEALRTGASVGSDTEQFVIHR